MKKETEPPNNDYDINSEADMEMVAKISEYMDDDTPEQVAMTSGSEEFYFLKMLHARKNSLSIVSQSFKRSCDDKDGRSLCKMFFA